MHNEISKVTFARQKTLHFLFSSRTVLIRPQYCQNCSIFYSIISISCVQLKLMFSFYQNVVVMSKHHWLLCNCFLMLKAVNIGLVGTRVLLLLVGLLVCLHISTGCPWQTCTGHCSLQLGQSVILKTCETGVSGTRPRSFWYHVATLDLWLPGTIKYQDVLKPEYCSQC